MTIYISYREESVFGKGDQGDQCNSTECPSDLPLRFVDSGTITSTERFNPELPELPPAGPIIYGLTIGA